MINSNLNYQIYACLPFVELAKETVFNLELLSFGLLSNIQLI
ncbi:hypothetical protein PRO82_001213 [Candidatus Protochlamydia amoebophila]|nr:hypothetical protein [Candidatus Protochlamydia amoebophila]